MDLYKGLFKKLDDFDKRLKALESTNQVQNIVIPSDGSISTGSTTIIDSEGLNSTANFGVQHVFNGAALLSTTSGSFVDVSGSSLNPVTITRDVRILLLIMGLGCNDDLISSNGASYVELEIYDSFSGDGVMNTFIHGIPTTNVTISGGSTNFNLSVNDQLQSRTDIVTALSGTHNYKLRYRSNNSGTSHLDAYTIGYIILGN